jgi:hypothetical protein
LLPNSADVLDVKKLSTADLADEYSEVRLRMMGWKPNVNPHAERFGELDAELLRRAERYPPHYTLQVPGNKFIVPISAQENRTTIVDPAAVYRCVRVRGLNVLLAHYKITLASIRKLFTEEKQLQFLSTARTGPRTIGEPVLADVKS